MSSYTDQLDRDLAAYAEAERATAAAHIRRAEVAEAAREALDDRQTPPGKAGATPSPQKARKVARRRTTTTRQKGARK